MDQALKQRIEEQIGANEVVLFMKGQRRLPQCGFSAQVVSILDQLVDDYQTVNVLADPEIRQGIKEFSEWPTIPQLYIRGQFVGGCDIVTQMFENGDLHQQLGKDAPKVDAPTLTVTEGAKKALSAALDGTGDAFVRLSVDSAWRPGLDITPAADGDFKVDVGGLTFVVDRGSAARANGISIDFVDGEQGGFKIDNPNEPPRVKPMDVTELKRRMDAGDAFQLIDVRTPDEQQIAKVDGAKLLDETLKGQIESLPKDTTLIFMCHTGRRSQNAAEYFLNQGFTKVYNVSGGIDAWSLKVDNSVRRY